MEYCGEVCTLTDFEARKVEYVRDKRRHYYFMSLRTDEVWSTQARLAVSMQEQNVVDCTV